MRFKKRSNHAQFRYSRALTAHHAKSFYFSSLLLPKAKRWATFALYGFCRYVDNLIDTPRDRSKTEIINELSYIENELQTSYRTGESEHPIISPFMAVTKHFDIPVELPMELIEGVKMDISLNRYESFDQLYLFAYRVAGVVGLMMTPVLGYSDPAALKYAEKLGIAMQLTNIIRDVKEDKNMDRIYFPMEEIQKFNLSVNDFFNERVTPDFRAFMQFQIDRAHSYFDQGDKGIHLLHRDARFAIQSASKIYRGILRKMELQNFNPFAGRVFVPQRTKISIVLSEVVRTRLLGATGL